MSVMTMVLAQDSTLPQPKPSDPGSMLLFPAIMIGLITFMLLTSRSQKKREQREKDDMYNRMAKNDRVLTVGGIIGTVIQVKDHEVILKVDESTNTRMTFLKSAIQRILSEEPSGGSERN